MREGKNPEFSSILPDTELTLTVRKKARAYLSSQAVGAWGEGVTADFLNIAVGSAMACAIPAMRERIQKLPTVEEYVEGKFLATGDPDALAAARETVVIMDQEFRSKANELVQEMNALRGDGLGEKDDTRARRFIDKYKEFESLLRGGRA